MRARGTRAAALALAVLLAAAWPAGCDPVEPGTVLSARLSGTARPGQIARICAPLFEGYGVPPVRHAVDSYALRFTSRDADGSPVEISAMLFVPLFDRAVPRPVLVFGSGTTGLGDECAPSLEEPEKRYFGRYRENMLAYAGMGFITVIPDYAGFGDPSRPQRYFSKTAEGHVMLDAARAVLRYMAGSVHRVQAMPVVFTAGYSQGGHAAFAAADMRGSYAPEVPLAGAIGFGSTNDVDAKKTGVWLGSPFKFHPHGQSGMELSELLPELGKHADEIAVIRSMVSEHENHEQACGHRQPRQNPAHSSRPRF